MTKIPYTKESARKLWTEARDKYQMQLDSKTRKNSYSREISGYGKKIRVELFYPEIFVSNFEATQIEMLFCKRLEELTTDKFMAFKESDWKFFIRDLIKKIAQ